jgi:solute:Na+ symporter, SSS family
MPSESQLQEDAQTILSKILHHQKQWVKVHAAEFLMELGKTKDIDSIFQKEEQLYGTEAPYRVGIWRVLSQIESQNFKWKVQLIQLAKDSSKSDQLHAIETLAKLKIPPLWMSYRFKNQILQGNNLRLKSYTQWALAIPETDTDKPVIDSLKKMLHSNTVEEKRIAALALRKLNYFPEDSWNELATLALEEPTDSDARVYLLAAAMTLCPDQNQAAFVELEKALLSMNDSKSNQYVLCETLAITGNKTHLRVLKNLMYSNNLMTDLESLDSSAENFDVNGAAAYAILNILKK